MYHGVGKVPGILYIEETKLFTSRGRCLQISVISLIRKKLRSRFERSQRQKRPSLPQHCLIDWNDTGIAFGWR